IGQVRNFVHRLSGESDQAFIAYNTASFSPSTGSPLPVALSSFTAQQTGSDALLQWNVTRAVKFAQFEVERSNGVAAYTSVGTVTYKDGQADYRFTDNEPLSGNNLYRLRLVDQDGKTAYSKIQKIDFGTVNNMVLYPNPCTDVINLRALEAGDVIHITNAAGVTMPVGTVNGSTLDVRHLANGIYTLSVYRNQQKVFATVVLKH
ncbi:MAG: T9SS type A sorting domain-containing protein, partial [Sphingobacteriales bacterium]